MFKLFKKMTEEWLNNMIPQLERLRKDFHAHFPELSTKEFKTAAKIQDYLEEFTTSEMRKVGETGTLAIFNSEKKGKTILVRADIDALPILESNTFNHRSVVKNVSHKCGHDGHTAILLGLARALTDYPLEKGRVILLWQPAEETGKGAMEVIKDNFFKNLSIDYAFALHNIPGYDYHKVILKKGSLRLR